MVRRIGTTLAALGAGALLVWLDWHPGSANPAAPTDRAGMITTVVLLAVLPWLLRPLVGPVAAHRTARILRAAGYLAMYALLMVITGLSRFAGSRFDHFTAFDQANHDAEMRSGAIFGFVVSLVLIGGYATTILVLTSRRAGVSSAVLGTGTAFGIGAAVTTYALAPFGGLRYPATALLLLVPGGLLAAAAPFAIRRAGPGPANDGALAGLCAGLTAALLLAIVTVSTMLMFPAQVPLKWANPDPNVAHGTQFEVQMSVGDGAVKYQVGLVFVPLLGWALGAVVSGRTRQPEPASAG